MSRIPPTVRWLCALQLFVLLGYSVLAPTWRAPDEPNHADLIVGVGENFSYPAYDDRDVDAGIRGSFSLVHFERHSHNLLEEEALPRDERPSRVDLREAGEDVDLRVMGRPGVGNHTPQHPPVYYVVMAGAAEAVDLVMPGKGLGAYDREVGVLRLLSLLLAVPLPLVAWWVARTARAPHHAAVAAAIGTLAIPQLTHIASVVNNDGVMVLIFGVLTGLMIRVGRGDLQVRTLVLLGAITGLGFFVKGSTFVVPLWAFAAMAIGYWRMRTGTGAGPDEAVPDEAAEQPAGTDWRWLVSRPAVFGVTAFALGGWWWLANIVRFGTYWPSIEFSTRLRDMDVRPPGFHPDPVAWFQEWGPAMLRSYWGNFGWVDVALPYTTSYLASVLVLVGVGLLLWPKIRGLRSPIDAPTVLLLVLPTLLLTALFGINTYRYYQDNGHMVGVQGRYLFGGVVGLAVVVAGGWERVARRWAPLTLLGAAAVIQGLAVKAMLEGWWGAPDASLPDRLRAMLAWSPWPGKLVIAVAVIGAAVAAATVRSLVLDARRVADGPDALTSA